MKIAMIGHKRIPSRAGGVEVAVEQLAVRMAALGHEVTVYNRGGGSGRIYYRGVRIVPVPSSPGGAGVFLYTLLATVLALLSRPDVIHFHAEGPCAMLPLASLFGVRCAATIHGLDWQRAKWGGLARRYLLLGEKAASRCKKLIVHTDWARQYFSRRYNASPRVIPNGAEAPTLLPPRIIAEKYGLQKDGYLLFLARLTPEKGLECLLEAFRQVKTDKKLLVAGGGRGRYTRKISSLAARDDRVIMAGFVQGDELSELYTSCFLYILPSQVEGMPLTLLEAMSYGARCLVSDIPENTETAGADALTFPVGDREALAAILQAILDGELSPPCGAELSARCLARFSWDEAAKRTLELYAESD